MRQGMAAGGSRSARVRGSGERSVTSSVTRRAWSLTDCHQIADLWASVTLGITKYLEYLLYIEQEAIKPWK